MYFVFGYVNNTMIGMAILAKFMLANFFCVKFPDFLLGFMYFTGMEK